MRRLAIVFLASGALGIGIAATSARPARAVPAAAAEPAIAPTSPASPSLRRVEKLSGRPSGFWTSTRPAGGGAYRWRMLAIGAVLAAVTAALLLRTARRASAERERLLAGGGPGRGPAGGAASGAAGGAIDA
jgi:hypothetical protein